MKALLSKQFLFSLCIGMAPPIHGGVATSVEGKRGAISVVTDNSFASKAALQTLEEGGNALDAAITALLTLNVVEPALGGIGGGTFLLYYDHKTKKMAAYDGRETAPKSMKSRSFLDIRGEPLPFEEISNCGLSVGVPGTLSALFLAHKEHGTTPWETLFAPAIALAKEGFPLSAKLKEKLTANQSRFETKEEVKELFYAFDENRWKEPGEIVKNPRLAELLQRIANQGAKAFYEGDIAEKIVFATKSRHTVVENKIIRSDKRLAGTLSLSDLRDYKAKSRIPIHTSYRGYEIYGLPPPSSAASIFEFLALTEELNIGATKANSLKRVHLTTEALKTAARDRARFFGDIDFVSPNMEQLFSPVTLYRKALAIANPEELKASQEEISPTIFGESLGEGSTTHISIIDRQGNGVSLTSSLERAFGSGILVQGFFLNNSLCDFRLRPTEEGVLMANRLEGGKRPLSSQSPLIAIDKYTDNIALVIGSSGGQHIFPTVAMAVQQLIGEKKDVAEIVSHPHLSLEQGKVVLEKGTRMEDYQHALRELGHSVIIGDISSGINVIESSNQGVKAASDQRQFGQALIEPI